MRFFEKSRRSAVGSASRSGHCKGFSWADFFEPLNPLTTLTIRAVHFSKKRSKWVAWPHFDHLQKLIKNWKNRGVAQLVARRVRDAKVVGSNPVASTKNPKNGVSIFGFFCLYGLRRDLRVGAVLREQNALPYKAWITKNLTAKDDVDNVGAGRAAKGSNPSACATEALEFKGIPRLFLFFKRLKYSR